MDASPREACLGNTATTILHRKKRPPKVCRQRIQTKKGRSQIRNGLKGIVFGNRQFGRTNPPRELAERTQRARRPSKWIGEDKGGVPLTANEGLEQGFRAGRKKGAARGPPEWTWECRRRDDPSIIRVDMQPGQQGKCVPVTHNLRRCLVIS